MPSIWEIITTEAERQGVSGYRLAKLSDTPLRTAQAYLSGTHDCGTEAASRMLAALGIELKPTHKAQKGG